MDYTSYKADLERFLVIVDTNGIAAFEAALPTIISLAELRIYREPSLDFLATRTVSATQQTTSGSRSVPLLPQFIVVEAVSLILPANKLPTDASATRMPLQRMTRSYLDMTWPQETLTQTPDLFVGGYWALFNEQEDATETPYNISNVILVAPTPDNTYNVEVSGTFRPAALSSTNQQTILTEYFPDLFFAASMLYGTSYQQNYGASADNPQQAVSWHAIYAEHLAVAGMEEQRKKFLGAGFSSFPPNPIALAPRIAPPPPPPAAGP